MREDERSSAAIAIAGLCATALLLVGGCQQQPEPRTLDEIRARGELRVVTINSPTSYYLGTHGAEGLEFDLARAFAQQLGVTLVISPVENVQALQAELLGESSRQIELQPLGAVRAEVIGRGAVDGHHAQLAACADFIEGAGLGLLLTAPDEQQGGRTQAGNGDGSGAALVFPHQGGLTRHSGFGR